jgi:predicted transcriptional regulator
MILYSSSPLQRLVGLAYVERVEERDPDGLWQLARDYGGGLTREELEEYFAGKKTAFGIMIRSVVAASVVMDPKELFPNFMPPQSFQYLSPEDFQRIIKAILPKGARF